MGKTSSHSCAYCNRSAETIAGAIENRQKANKNTEIDILYQTSSRHLACARCVSMHFLVLRNGGNPLVTYKPKDKNVRFIENERLLKASILESVELPDEQTYFK